MGTATGFIIKRGYTEIVRLPGIPKEMQPLLNKYLESGYFLDSCLRKMDEIKKDTIEKDENPQ